MYRSINRCIKGCLVDEALTELLTAGPGMVSMQPGGINSDHGTPANKKPEGEDEGKKEKSDNDTETKLPDANNAAKEKSVDDESSLVKENGDDTKEKPIDKDKEEWKSKWEC